MMRFVLFCLFILVALGSCVFHVKYRVIHLENEFLQTTQKIHEGREAIKVLQAEWSYLCEPKRLQTLCEKFLELSPVLPRQLVNLGEITQVVDAEAWTESPEPHEELMP